MRDLPKPGLAYARGHEQIQGRSPQRRVIAIAITLLILEIKVPEGAGQDLPHQLAEQWPSYVSYLVAFVSAPACLAINAALAVYYAIPGAGMMRHPE